jgi:acetolactate synthase I/II/III large subunit
MTVAEAIVSVARDVGCGRIFGLPGSGALLDVLDAARRVDMPFVATAHESSAAIAAASYGRFRGCSGLALAIKGPGAGNLVGGALNAQFGRLPVVCLCETAPASLLGRPLAQVCDQRALFSGATKGAFRLAPEGALETTRAAFSLAAAGLPGAVLLELPGDIGRSPAQDPAGPRSGAGTTSAGRAPEVAIAAARSLAGSFSRPLVIMGADVGRAGAAVQAAAMARGMGAAVLLTMEARGVFPENDPSFAGVYTGLPGPRMPASIALAAADGVVLVGVDALMTEAPWRSGLRTLEIVARPGEPTLTPSPRLRLEGDLAASLSALTDVRCTPGFSADDILAARRSGLSLCARPPAAKLAVQDIIAITREQLPDEGVLFSETGVFVLMLEHLWRAPRPDTFFGTSAGRTMGLMVPAALGAKLARPDLPMVGIGGDASLLLRLGELEAFGRTGAAVPLVVVNDRALGTIQARQKHRGLPRWGLELSDVRFADIARACGLGGATVHTPEEYRQALRAALAAPRATLIDARVDPDAYQDSFVETSGA